MNLFDILGPVMVGPSSSHTAGAVRIGDISGILFLDYVVKEEILLHVSLPTTVILHVLYNSLFTDFCLIHPDYFFIFSIFFFFKKI